LQGIFQFWSTEYRLLSYIRLCYVGVKQTVPAVAATFAPSKRGRPEIALHRAQTQPDLLRDGTGGPALAVQGPDLLMQRLPTCLALRYALLFGHGRLGGWHGHGDRPIGQRYELLAQHVIDRVEGVAMGGEHWLQGLSEILQQMKTVRNLHGSRGALTRPRHRRSTDPAQSP
jgi:hypothetical protein